MKNDKVTVSLPAEILNPLCKPFSRQADWILDLYEMTQQPSYHPGKCLNCFYALLESASDEKHTALAPLRKWIEENTVIKVRAGDTITGIFPVHLNEPDLSSFCEQAIQTVREKNNLSSSHLILELHYKSHVKAA